MKKRLLLWLPFAGFVVLFVVVSSGLFRPSDHLVHSKMVGKELPLTICGVNPRLGAELDVLDTPAATTRRKVLVAGSGPGGLSAAVTASARGHDVTLYEAGPTAGGTAADPRARGRQVGQSRRRREVAA